MALGLIFAAANMAAGMHGVVSAIVAIVGTFAGVAAFIVFTMTLKNK
jgi:hypothetical protein